MRESEFIARLRPLATHIAARALLDDAAVLDDLVLTHDVLVEGVHFLPNDPPSEVAWKLLAVNLSDLAAKGATPIGVLLGYPLGNDAWDLAFIDGLAEALTAFDCSLLGGDSVSGPRVLSMTAIGRSVLAPSRAGAREGDAIWITGSIGGAGVGLALLTSTDVAFDCEDDARTEAIARYRQPIPRLEEGRLLAPHVTAMMDVSDGLLIDASRLAAASGIAIAIDLDRVPVVGEAMAAVTAGDDYELLFAAAPDFVPPVAATRIGQVALGAGVSLHRSGVAVPLPDRLGWSHDGG